MEHLPLLLADLCKHTSGCSANKSRLYCPLTSAELLIVNVTQLQRRAFYCRLGQPVLSTGWLTAANASHLSNHMKHNRQAHGHSNTTLPFTVGCTGLAASGRFVSRRLARPTKCRFYHHLRRAWEIWPHDQKKEEQNILWLLNSCL